MLAEPLKNDKAEGQPGWKNVDISYIPGDDYIALFFDGESESASFAYTHHIVGKVDDVSVLKAWPRGSITIRFERF